MIEEFYPEYQGTNNPDNGAKSLLLFSRLSPGDFVFVRGIAKILDLVLITGTAKFEENGDYQDDYFLKVPFVPLFSDRQSTIETANKRFDQYFIAYYLILSFAMRYL